jgi:hypothetical protein
MCHADLPTEPARWPAPPPSEPAARERPTGTAAIVVGIAGSIVGAVVFVAVWLIGNITLNTCRYAHSGGAVDVGRARVWLSIATVSWAAMPIIAGALAKRAERNAQVWYVIALGHALAGVWAVATLGPWELCL